MKETEEVPLSADKADECGSVVETLMGWASRHPVISFGNAVRYLSEHGHRTPVAHDFIRGALDLRLLIARTPLGEIRDETDLIPAALRRGVTTEHDVTQKMGDADHRRQDADDTTTCLWSLAKGRIKPPKNRWIALHRERDRSLACDFGRSHVPFGPILLGETLLLRCRFCHLGILRTHRIEVR